MALTVGVNASEHIAVAVVNGNEIVGEIHRFPERGMEPDLLAEMHAEEIVEQIEQQVSAVSKGHRIEAVGVAFPGIIRDGVVDESPNLPQMKGQRLATALSSRMVDSGSVKQVHVMNDADAMAAGIAADRNHLDKLVRVWFLGSGIGYGRYPQTGAAGEGGHMVVTLEPRENLCRCTGIGHLEGIMGHRAMRLRFLDLEPDEVFDRAKSGDTRCVAFVELWHRALAAATANVIHLEGPGKFYVLGPNARFVNTDTLQTYLHAIVKMSPLQGSAVEVVPTTDEIAILGAAVSAHQIATGARPPLR
jgi:glucokinase